MTTHKISRYKDPIMDLQIKKLVDIINQLQAELDALEERVAALELQ